MLTPEQISALRDRAAQIADPINDFLLEDIARRIAEAGQLTSTAAYQVWRAQNLGMSQRQVKQELKRLLKRSDTEIEALLTQSAEVGYNFDLSNLPTAAAIPFAENPVMQQIVSAAVELAREDFTNLTQTLGMIDPYGRALPLQKAYRACTDFAFKQVITGATDYNTAIRRACKNLAEQGVQVIDYESGVHTSLEAAVRRNIMGGLGLMQEQISQANHDQMGCDGWEISAHAASAPDHEPIQGRQYRDAAYERLNNSLKRRIGTLNCGHAAYPIILGVSTPQYTPDELEKLRADNEKGVTVDGRHYTAYEATQHQRKLERAIRAQKRRVLVSEAAGDADTLLTDRIKLQRLWQNYNRFSSAAGLRTQNERTQIAGFGRKQAARAHNDGKEPANQRVEKNPTVHTAFSEDVTEEYIKNAAPGSGLISYENGYQTKNHENEIKTAKWLHETFGGDIVLLRESSVDGVKRPDYLWKNRKWDLKNTTTVKAADSALRHGLKQIQENPGGIILDYGDAEIEMDKLVKTIDGRMRRKENGTVDVMIRLNGEVRKILRYKK